jgi:hypothetical protein
VIHSHGPHGNPSLQRVQCCGGGPLARLAAGSPVLVRERPRRVPAPGSGFDQMREVALARMWRLADGTSCLLLKDPRADYWEIRVSRGDEVIRAEFFGSPIIAMDRAKQWRAVYDPAFEPSG